MATLQVININDSGPGSLRSAILLSNSIPDTPITISFTVAGVIVLNSLLPPIKGHVVIDGRTAPPPLGYVSGPLIELNQQLEHHEHEHDEHHHDEHDHPENFGHYSHCHHKHNCESCHNCDNAHQYATLTIDSNHVTIYGLSIISSTTTCLLINGSYNTIDGCYIGLDLLGAASGSSKYGIIINKKSHYNVIGLNPLNDSSYISNVISGHKEVGVVIYGNRNKVQNNFIGTNITGSSAIPNGYGITLMYSFYNEIGGTVFVNSLMENNNPTGSKATITPTFIRLPLSNLISGNMHSGIYGKNCNYNTIFGNYIGTDITGQIAIPNYNGVYFSKGQYNNILGCKIYNEPFVFYNVISGNKSDGIVASGVKYLTIQGNFIGINSTNNNAVGNGGNGLLIKDNSEYVLVGSVIPLGSVISGNLKNGIEVCDTSSGFTSFNSFVGGLAFGSAAPNGQDGIKISSSGGNNLIQTSILSGNLGNGLTLCGKASGVTVSNTIIGLNTQGITVMSNGGNGIEMRDDANNNIVGVIAESVISTVTTAGNNGYGIVLKDRVHDNQIYNTNVGLNNLGISLLGNQLGGIRIADQATRNIIGKVLEVNFIAGNGSLSNPDSAGILIEKEVKGNTISGNWISVNKLLDPAPNVYHDILDKSEPFANVIFANNTTLQDNL